MITSAWLPRIRKSTFIRHNAIFFGGALLTGFFNYLYYPVLGRLMSPVPFGETQTLVSLFLQIATFLTVLGLLAVNIVVNHSDSRVGNRLVIELEKLALIIGLLLVGAAVVFGPALRDYFHFGSTVPFVILMLAVVASVTWTFRSAFLRAKQKFGLYSIANFTSSALKIVASVALVVAGFGTSGALAGLALSQVFASVYVVYYARKYGFNESLLRRSDGARQRRLPDFTLIRPELRYALLVLVCSLAITVLYSVDILVVKHYFDAETAGLYASIATVSRILFFLTASVAQVMLPNVKLHGDAKQNTRILLKSFALVTIIGGATLLIFWLAPRLVIKILMGSTYLTYAHLLPRLGLAIFFVSIANLLLTYFMALRKYLTGLLAVIGTAVTYGLLVANHQSLEAIVDSLLTGSVLLTALLGIWLILDQWPTLHKHERSV